MAIDPNRRPFVVVDPRAGHSRWGLKRAEIGMGRAVPVLFHRISPGPVLGKPSNIMRGSHFLEKSSPASRADGTPCVIGIAGWLGDHDTHSHPADCLASYCCWFTAGTGLACARSMRYTGGLLGGSWLTLPPVWGWQATISGAIPRSDRQYTPGQYNPPGSTPSASISLLRAADGMVMSI
jgi:hypothetical protein